MEQRRPTHQIAIGSGIELLDRMKVRLATHESARCGRSIGERR
jgi:hypothetical protein